MNFAVRPARISLVLGVASLLALAACGAPIDSETDTPTEDAVLLDFGPRPVRDVTTDSPRPGMCIDADHDGFGIDCEHGLDCDDSDPSVTDACYRCLGNANGCPCVPNSDAVSCDLLTDTDHPLAGECHLGQRNCVEGAWGHCVAIGNEGARTITPPQPCVGVCTPGCNTAGACPNTSADLATGTGVVLGSAPAPVFCPPGSPPGGVTLQGGITPPAGTSGTGTACTGLCLRQVNCAGGTSTTLTGTVRAPTPSTYLAAGTLADPLYNAVVYVPNGPVAAFAPGITCDICGAPASGSPLVSAITGFDGAFTLSNVPTGANIPLVIQLGRWRRQIVIPNVAPCTNTVLTPDQTRLPRNQSEGDIPLMALSTGDVDGLECVLRKIGIDDSEFTVPSANGGRGRVQLYLGNGEDVAAGGAPAASALYGDASRLAGYDMVLFACEGAENRKAAADQQRIIDYTNGGGRIFATHFSYVWLFNDAPFSSTALWNAEAASPPDPILSTIDESFPKGRAMSQWLWLVNASPSPGQISLTAPRHDFDGVVAPSQDWVYANRLVAPVAGASCGPGLTLCSGTCRNLQTSPVACGACGTTCSGGGTCQSGVCACPAGWTSCSGTCRNLRADVTNCGTCGTACAAGLTCEYGVCGCPAGWTQCGTTCRDLRVDAANCGTCSNACTATGTCVGGVCACPGRGTVCFGACADTSTDTNNCGGCGNVCPVNARCSSGVCACPAGFVVCGGICVETSTDNVNCGACGTSCPSGSRRCSAGTCRASCPSGTTDCSRDCVNTSSDWGNCGGCGTTCGAREVCVAGACVPSTGLTNCTGADVDLMADALNCGSCGRACGVSQACTAGVCSNLCAAGLNFCGGTCLDVRTDRNNCGGCGRVCGAAQLCADRVCVCPGATTACGSSCVDTSDDRNNCGSCGNACGTGSVCQAGACSCPTGEAACGSACAYTASDASHCGGTCATCGVGADCVASICTCPLGFVNCGGTCRNPLTDHLACGPVGACGVSCSGSRVCSAGACVTSGCLAGSTNCGRDCVVLTTDPFNCGACGNRCAIGQSCTAGACVAPLGEAVCAGATADLRTDFNNCGACGNLCPGGSACVLGACTCTGGRTNCGGTCVTTATNATHCGGCGVTCGSGATCSSGVCTCPAGQTLCSGRCVALNTDASNCGACDTACPAPRTCAAGTCSCPAGTTLCGGVCVPMANDPANCGACGNVCTGGRTCVAGACTNPCAAGLTSCSSSCRNLQTDVGNCGACGTTCAASQTCTAGACVTACAPGLTYCNGTCLDTQTDPNNCGACAATCGTGGVCVTGACRVTNYLHYTFNTPVGSPAASQCGRAVFSDFHVNNVSNGGGRRFPAACNNTPMTAQEKILEFMLFDLASCIAPTGTSGPVCAAGTTPCGGICCLSSQTCQTVGAGTQCFTPYPATGTFTQDIDGSASCSVGSAPQWTNLVYVASTPAGTSIGATFYTAATAAGLATATGVSLGTIPMTASPIDLRAALATARVSGILPYSRVVFTLNSDATRTLTPTLSAYQVNFVCQASF